MDFIVLLHDLREVLLTAEEGLRLHEREALVQLAVGDGTQETTLRCGLGGRGGESDH